MAKRNVMQAYRECPTFGLFVDVLRVMFVDAGSMPKLLNFLDKEWAIHRSDWEHDENVSYDEDTHLDDYGVFYWTGKEQRFPHQLKVSSCRITIPACEGYDAFTCFVRTEASDSGTVYLNLYPSTKVRDKVVLDQTADKWTFATNNETPRYSKPVISLDENGSLRIMRFVNSGYAWFSGAKIDKKTGKPINRTPDWVLVNDVDKVLKNLHGMTVEIDQIQRPRS